jgi:hypothetical protein
MAPQQPQTRLTDDMIKKINDELDAIVRASGFGEIVLVIEWGELKWIRPAPSLPLKVATVPLGLGN